MAGVIDSVSKMRDEFSDLSSAHQHLRSDVECQARSTADEINSLKKAHLDEINSVKQSLSQLSSIVSTSASTAVPTLSSSHSDSAGIVIRGVPADITLPDSEIVRLVFSSLGASKLLDDVFDSRFMKPKSSQPSNSTATPSMAIKTSLVCRMTSIVARDLFLEKAFGKKTLSVRDVFSLNRDDRIYCSELLPPHTHKLLLLTKSKARALKLTRVWANQGVVKVRREGCPDVFVLRSESDLEQLA